MLNTGEYELGQIFLVKKKNKTKLDLGKKGSCVLATDLPFPSQL